MTEKHLPERLNGVPFQCGDNPALVGYLYDDCEPADRAAIAQHVAICAACAAELAALESTRGHLASWAPPEADLGFQIVRGEATAPVASRILTAGTFAARPWWKQPIPAWAQAAAAVLIFAAGVSIGVARNGALNNATEMAAATAAPSAQQPAATAISAQDLAALEQRLRTEIMQVQATTAQAGPRVANTSGGVSPSDLDALEQRLRTEMAVRIGQFAGDFETQRRIDLARVEQLFTQNDRTIGAEIVRQRQAIDNVNNLIRTSLQGR